MTVSNLSTKLETSIIQIISCLGNYAPRKLTRLFWTLLVTVGLLFTTHFLYAYQFDHDVLSSTANIVISQNQKQQHPFYNMDSLITDSLPHTKSVTKSTLAGHNATFIARLLRQNNEAILDDHSLVADITVILHYSDKEMSNIKTQIQSILAQSVQPKQIWILCRSNKPKKSLETKFGIHSTASADKIKVKIIPHDDQEPSDNHVMLVKDAPWLLLQQSIPTTAYVWILEPNAIPKPEYLYYTYGLMNTEEYKHSIIGYDTSLFSTKNTSPPPHVTRCLRSSQIEKSRSVDMIHSSWLLRTQWLRSLRADSNAHALQLPLGYFISSTLLYRAGITSVVIPSSTKLLLSFSCQKWLQNGGPSHILNSVYPNVAEQELIYQETSANRVSILLAGPNHAIALLPLMCKLFNDDKQYNVHLILANGLTHRTFQDILDQNHCTNSHRAMIHDLTLAYNNGVYYDDNGSTAEEETNYITPIANLLRFIQPEILIHIKEPNTFIYRSIKSLAELHGITSIGLPAQDVHHALWMADLSVKALSHWNHVKIDLVVITDRRPVSLSRLLNSTNNAYYFGDENVELAIHMEQSADRETRTLVQGFEFKHGDKKVRHRVRKGGLLPAIVESWYPSNNDNYGVLLEDDIELSPFFYSWSKYNILKYRYESEKAHNHIYGVSLYSPRNLELRPEGRRPFNPEPVLEQGGYSKRAPYATQIPCSWGAVYFPEHWREFHTYITERVEKEEKYTKGYYNITVPGSRSERWSKSWKKYFIEMVYLRAYVMVYPNFANFESFSTNHLEYGTHVQQKNNGRAKSKVDQFLVPLMQQDTILTQLPDRHLPDFDHLPIMDLWGRIRTLSELDHVGSQWHTKVSHCVRNPIGTFDAKDILCPFPNNVAKSKKKDIRK
ncbi:hypothetical protein HMPREF1544_01264 [Mucor circinelloides 1006PhL]|uniref:Glycosyl transferase 64 domain-containing protein n=1 Tax=Mucor circinelloides f. circinelloides (strain 1006PhL) TaxID=1220926 RepID=S2KHT9_MUCC1|nr:hypothetical protein HMPREF1544_01264 [Mucor circinelloides 1006PhL]KAG1119940.1 hypothetical protein G6F42_012862 [Rhizopus arrhizus]